jgi:hypothetical protein
MFTEKDYNKPLDSDYSDMIKMYTSVKNRKGICLETGGSIHSVQAILNDEDFKINKENSVAIPRLIVLAVENSNLNNKMINKCKRFVKRFNEMNNK